MNKLINKEDYLKLKYFLKNENIPKYFYNNELYDFIEKHMVIISQIDRLLFLKESPLLKYVDLLDKDDVLSLNTISIKDVETKIYFEHLKIIIDILKKYC